MDDTMQKPMDILDKRILITGDVNTGKTTLSRTLVEGLCLHGLSARIVIVDMAPEIPEEIAVTQGIKGVGGKLLAAGWAELLYLSATLKPPRLSSKSEQEALFVAEENSAKIDGLLQRVPGTGRDILFINDVSMYLQAGSARALLKWIGTVPTVVANGYFGRKLGTGILSMKEASEMKKLMASFPFHVSMPGASLEEVLRGKIPK